MENSARYAKTYWTCSWSILKSGLATWLQAAPAYVGAAFFTFFAAAHKAHVQTSLLIILISVLTNEGIWERGVK